MLLVLRGSGLGSIQLIRGVWQYLVRSLFAVCSQSEIPDFQEQKGPLGRIVLAPPLVELVQPLSNVPFVEARCYIDDIFM